MKFGDLFLILRGKTDVDVVLKGLIITTFKYDFNYLDLPPATRDAEVAYLTAVDCRTIEIGLKDEGACDAQ